MIVCMALIETIVRQHEAWDFMSYDLIHLMGSGNTTFYNDIDK